MCFIFLRGCSSLSKRFWTETSRMEKDVEAKETESYEQLPKSIRSNTKCHLLCFFCTIETCLRRPALTARSHSMQKSSQQVTPQRKVNEEGQEQMKMKIVI